MRIRSTAVVLVAACATCAILQSPGIARAQTMPRVGYLTSQKPDFFFEAFKQRMAELHYVDGRNLVIDRLDLDGRLDQAGRFVAELAKGKPKVIVLPNVASMNAAKRLGLNVPFVAVSSIDPVVAGFAASLSRPGGNFTGIANLQRHLSAKRLEVVKDVLPKVLRVAVLWDTNGPGPKVAASAYEAAGKKLKLFVHSFPIRDPNKDFGNAFERAREEKAEVIVIVSNPLFGAHRDAIAALAEQYKVPMVGEHEYWADAGALLTFGANIPDIGHRIADFVHRILQGAKPGDLPFEQPTKFDLVVNLKTAKALGITVPQSVLVRADKVIE